MATRQLLAALVEQWHSTGGTPVAIESVGGVDAAARVQNGEEFDGVVLAREAIEKLVASGSVVAASRVDLVQSSVAVAVRAGSVPPDISTEAALRSAVMAAPTIGYSTGPSGSALLKLFEKWGIGRELQHRTVQAPPGTPVGSLVARGEVAVGFQQLSELMSLGGVAVVGVLPKAVAITTVFSAAVCSACTQREKLDALLAFMASPEVAATKLRYGMHVV